MTVHIPRTPGPQDPRTPDFRVSKESGIYIRCQHAQAQDLATSTLQVPVPVPVPHNCLKPNSHTPHSTLHTPHSTLHTPHSIISTTSIFPTKCLIPKRKSPDSASSATRTAPPRPPTPPTAAKPPPPRTPAIPTSQRPARPAATTPARPPMTEARPSPPPQQLPPPPPRAAAVPLRLRGRTRATWLTGWTRGSIVAAIRPRFRKRCSGVRMTGRTYRPNLRGGSRVRIHHRNSDRVEEEEEDCHRC